MINESMFYSKGNYYLMEHWKEDGKNIYSKTKHEVRKYFLESYKEYLTEQDIRDIDDGKNVIKEQEDGTTLFFKHCNF